MSPLKLQMLLHFYCCCDRFENIDAPSQSEAIQDFINDKLLVFPVDLDRPRLTERGEAHVKFLCCLPLPIANWHVPGPWVPLLPFVS